MPEVILLQEFQVGDIVQFILQPRKRAQAKSFKNCADVLHIQAVAIFFLP
jgi:hypothetical protein